MESKKRKRETELPRITYDAATRTFDRLFKEDSLDDMKAVVRKKLGLSPSLPVYLSQWRDGKSVDLEDDEDFEAFSASARASLAVKVKVILGEHHPLLFTAETEGMSSSAKRKLNKSLKRGANEPTKSADDSSESNSTPETEEIAHRSKRRKVSFAEEISNDVQTPSKSKSKEKKTKDRSRFDKGLSTDTESEQTQTEGDIEKKRRNRRKRESGKEKDKSGSKKTRSHDSSTAPTDSTLDSVHIAAKDEVSSDSKQKSKDSKKKRPHVSVSPSPNTPDPATSTSETAARTVNSDEHERLGKKAKKKASDVSAEGSLPPSSQPSSHSAKVSIENTADIAQDATTPKKSKKSTDSLTKKDSSLKPISKARPIIEKPKSALSSTSPTSPIAPAVAIPDKETSVKKQKQKVDFERHEELKEKTKKTSSGSKDISIPETAKALPSIPDKPQKGKKKVAAESENPAPDKVGEHKKDLPETVDQPSETEGPIQAESIAPTQTIDMKEITRRAVANILKKKAANKNSEPSSEATHPTNQHPQPESLEPDRMVQPNATTQEEASSSVVATQPPTTQPSNPTKTVDKSHKPPPTEPTEEPSCPVCDSTPSHPRNKCQVIKAGIRSMRKRIAELEKEESEEGAEARSNIIQELQVFIQKKTRKPRVSAATKTHPDQPPATNPPPSPLSVETPKPTPSTEKGATQPSLDTASTQPSSSIRVENPKPAPSTEKGATQSTLDTAPTQPSSSIRASSSNKAKPPVSVINSKSASTIQASPVQASLSQSASQLPAPSQPSKRNNLNGSSKGARHSLSLPSEIAKNLFSSELNGFGDVSSFTDQDLDALVRGPRLSLKNMVPESDSETEEESEAEEDVVLEEDQVENKQSQRNLSRSGYPSSSDEVEEDDDEPVPPSPLNQSEQAIAEEEEEGADLSFLEVNGLGSSVELDRTGDLAANAAVAADLAPLNSTEAHEGKPKDHSSNENSDSSDSDVPSPANSPPTSMSPIKPDVADPIEPSDNPPASQPEPIVSDEEVLPAESTPKVAVRTRSQRSAVAKKVDSKSTEKLVSESKAVDVEEAEVEEVPKPARRTRSLMKISELPIPPNPSVRVIRQTVAPTPRTRRQIALEQEKEKEATPEPEPAPRTRRATAANKPKAPVKTPVKPPSRAAKTTAKPLSKQKAAITATGDNEKVTGKPADLEATQTLESSVQVQPTPSSQKDKNVSSWAVLQESQPSQTETEALGMVDELLSSPKIVPNASPNDQSGKGQKPVSIDGSQPDPLFIPAESQQSFPYSQYPDVIPPKNEAHASPNDSEDEDEVVAAVTKPVIGTNTAKYRSLRELASQQGRLFQPRPSQIMKSVREPRVVEDLYGGNGQQSEDSDSGTDSDAEEKPASHIPAARRAGAPTRR